MQWLLVAVGLGVHLVFFYSIFDIYFTSPLVHGMSPHSTTMTAPARRLVLFVADGLRADKLFELNQAGLSRAPYIRHIVEQEGAWGVSHTRVPTESRPGHVALIAGFYEDVSAVAKGWKENPVGFDSVFNESRFTWSWGSPDILPMFAQGATGHHVFTSMYPAESEDFAGSDSSKLDTWVFDEVKDFLQHAKQNITLDSMLREDKVVLFMHLLGLDTNGHAHRPYSDEYLENIRTVDAGLKEMVELIEQHFGHDEKTAFVLSSDHGMTNWGSHGAGHPSETLTPLVAWGAGVRRPLPSTPEDVYEDNFQNEWQLNNIKRSDVNQADICPLMTSLLGVPYPLNSVGVLPLDYLNNSDEFKAEDMFINARQILAQFEIKMHQKQETTLSAFFTPFRLLTPSIQTNKIRTIRSNIQNGRFTDAIAQSREMIGLALEGLLYYHNYDRLFLGTSIALGFVGWIGYVITVLLEKHSGIVQPRLKLDTLNQSFWQSEKGIRLLFVLLGTVVILLLYEIANKNSKFRNRFLNYLFNDIKPLYIVQSLPWMHYLYCMIPLALWHKVLQKKSVFRDLYWFVLDTGLLFKASLWLFLGICGVEIIVLSFFYRELLTVGLAGLAFWPLCTRVIADNKPVAYGWIGSCGMLCIFPLLPVVGRDANYSLVFLAGIIALGLATFAATRCEVSIFNSHGRKSIGTSGSTQLKVLTSIQLLILSSSIWLVWNTSNSIKNKEGLPLFNQIASWLTLISSFLLPLLSCSRMLTRLLNIVLAFLPTYILFSTSYEALFCITLCVVLFFWLQMENELMERKTHKIEELEFGHSVNLAGVKRKLAISDLRIAYIFIYLLIVAFFGTGNIASINSFDPASVYSFVTVFRPFMMGGLMLWKILIPILLVTCTFNAVHLTINVPTQSLFLLVLLMSDVMGLHFFFLVKDHGSWLDIGTSISHYVIVMSMICFLLVLLTISKIFTDWGVHLTNLTKLGKQQ